MKWVLWKFDQDFFGILKKFSYICNRISLIIDNPQRAFFASNKGFENLKRRSKRGRYLDCWKIFRIFVLESSLTKRNGGFPVNRITGEYISQESERYYTKSFCGAHKALRVKTKGQAFVGVSSGRSERQRRGRWPRFLEGQPWQQILAMTPKDCQSYRVTDETFIVLTRRRNHFGENGKRNFRIFCAVEWVALAGKNRKAYIPTPLKRWNGIEGNHVFHQVLVYHFTKCILVTSSKTSKSVVHSLETMQLSTCDMVAARVPQGNRRNETSMQLVGG